MSRTIFLIRHGNRQDFVEQNWRKTAKRPNDPGLSTDGKAQVKRLGDRLSTKSIDAVFSSPYLRAVQTASIVSRRSSIDQVFLEPGLGERLNPSWFNAAPDLLKPRTLSQRFDCVSLKHTPCLIPSFPESKDEAFQRMGETSSCILSSYKLKEIIFVGHGGTVQGVTKQLVGKLPKRECHLASLTEIVKTQTGWDLVNHADISHLRGQGN